MNLGTLILSPGLLALLTITTTLSFIIQSHLGSLKLGDVVHKTQFPVHPESSIGRSLRVSSLHVSFSIVIMEILGSVPFPFSSTLVCLIILPVNQSIEA